MAASCKASSSARGTRLTNSSHCFTPYGLPTPCVYPTPQSGKSGISSSTPQCTPYHFKGNLCPRNMSKHDDLRQFSHFPPYHDVCRSLVIVFFHLSLCRKSMCLSWFFKDFVRFFLLFIGRIFLSLPLISFLSGAHNFYLIV